MMQKVNKKQGRVECKGRRTVVIGRGGGEGVDNSDNFMTDSAQDEEEVPTKEGSLQSPSSGKPPPDKMEEFPRKNQNSLSPPRACKKS